MTNVLKIRSHDDLIASIPHTLGFTPQGMVCLAFGGGPTARLDIPSPPRRWMSSFRSSPTSTCTSTTLTESPAVHGTA